MFRHTKERKHDFEHKELFEQRINGLLKHSNECEILTFIESSKKVKGYGSIKEHNLNIFKKHTSENSINAVKI